MSFVPPSPVWVWSVPFAPVTLEQTLEWVDQLIHKRQPSQIVTVNLHTVMLAHQDPRMKKVLHGAAFNIADGMPLIWASRWRQASLPERVAGSDLLPALF